MKAINVLNPINITGVNDEFKPFANVDAKYGPYTDLATARSVLEHYLTKGLTIGIIEGNEIVEYWIKDDTNEFVIKNQSNESSNEKVIKKINYNDLKQVDLNGGESTHTIQLPVGDIFIYDDNSSISIYHENGTLCTLLPNHIYKVVQSDYKDANNNIIRYAKDLLIDDRANGGFTKITNKVIDCTKKVNYIQHKASDGDLIIKIDRTNLIAGNEYKIIIENTGGDTDVDFKVKLNNEIIDRRDEENLPIKCLTADGTVNIFIPPTGILVLNLLIYEQNYTLKGLVTYELTSNCIMAI